MLKIDNSKYPKQALMSYLDIYRNEQSITKYNWLLNFYNFFLSSLGEESVLGRDLLLGEDRRHMLLQQSEDFLKGQDTEKSSTSISLIGYATFSL